VARLTTMGVRIAWRVLHARRDEARTITVPAAPAAPSAPPPALAAVATAAVDPQLVESWRTDLDDLADLAASFADPAEAETAERRRAAFSADAVARRLSAALQTHDAD